MKDIAYAYLLRCADGSFYAGWTSDPKRRLKSHNSGKGSKYTRSRLPVSFALIEQFNSKNEAMRREAALKKLSHSRKAALAAGADQSLLAEFDF